jgi:hypothetical protein
MKDRSCALQDTAVPLPNVERGHGRAQVARRHMVALPPEIVLIEFHSSALAVKGLEALRRLH